jgi:hypothetical protein
MKRLRIVHVEFEYAVWAESDDDALSVLHDAAHDDSTIAERATVALAADDGYTPPDQWDDDVLVYGFAGDVKYKEAVDIDRNAAKGAK